MEYLLDFIDFHYFLIRSPLTNLKNVDISFVLGSWATLTSQIFVYYEIGFSSLCKHIGHHY